MCGTSSVGVSRVSPQTDRVEEVAVGEAEGCERHRRKSTAKTFVLLVGLETQDYNNVLARLFDIFRLQFRELYMMMIMMIWCPTYPYINAKLSVTKNFCKQLHKLFSVCATTPLKLKY